MGAGTNPAERKFFCVVNQTTFRRFPSNLVAKRIPVSRRKIRKDFFEKDLHVRGHLPPKSEIDNRSNRHLTQSRLQVTRCTAERYCLNPRCSPRAREFPIWVSFSLRRTVAELRGVKLSNFRILAYFPIQNP